MRIHDPHTESEEPYNLVPLTDMVFNLLIFFMCATTFVQIEKDLKVQLPKASSAFVPISAPPKQLVINIEQDGATTVAGKTYSEGDLASLVASAVKVNPDQTVIIRDDDSQHFAIPIEAGRRRAKGYAHSFGGDPQSPGAAA